MVSSKSSCISYKNILNEKAALEVVIADRERQHYKDRIEKLEAEVSPSILCCLAHPYGSDTDNSRNQLKCIAL